MDAFYVNLEDYVHLLQGEGAKVYLVLGVPIHHRFNPGEMVTRTLTGFRIAPDVEKAIPTAGLQAVHVTANAKLRTVGQHTGATLLDPFLDICGGGDGCLPFFGAGEPKFFDHAHLRPIFVREHLCSFHCGQSGRLFRRKGRPVGRPRPGRNRREAGAAPGEVGLR